MELNFFKSHFSSPFFAFFYEGFSFFFLSGHFCSNFCFRFGNHYISFCCFPILIGWLMVVDVTNITGTNLSWFGCFPGYWKIFPCKFCFPQRLSRFRLFSKNLKLMGCLVMGRLMMGRFVCESNTLLAQTQKSS